MLQRTLSPYAVGVTLEKAKRQKKKKPKNKKQKPKDPLKKMKRIYTEKEKIFVNYVSGKGV